MFKWRSQRKKRRQGSVVFGGLFFLMALGLLTWNEGRAIKTARSLEEGSDIVLSVAADAVDAENDGKLVHMIGQISTPDEVVVDQGLSLAFPDTIKIRRDVQMFQWKRESQGKGSNSSERYITTWSSTRIKSDKYPSAYQNPGFEFSKTTFLANSILLGAFDLSAGLTRKISTSNKIVLDNTDLLSLNPSIKSRATVHDGDLYLAHNGLPRPSDPQVGDLRMTFYAARPMMASVVAQQQGNRLIPYQTKAGVALALLEPGRLESPEMFAQAQQENTILTWGLRGGGLFLMYMAFHSMFFALLKIFRRVPILGGIAESGAQIVSGVLAVVVTLPTIAIAWIAYRPVIGIGIIVAVVPVIVLLVLYTKKRAARELQESTEKRIMQLAMQKGGKLTVPEVVVDSNMDIEAAQQGLEALARKGMAGVEVTDSGVIVYVFSTIQHLDDKALSKDILEP